MNTLRRRLGLGAAVSALALGLAAGSGCQTYFPETGQTLPTGHYLEHPPQYIPPTPQFPLAREQANLEKATLQPGGPVPRPGGPPLVPGP